MATFVYKIQMKNSPLHIRMHFCLAEQIGGPETTVCKVVVLTMLKLNIIVASIQVTLTLTFLVP